MKRLCWMGLLAATLSAQTQAVGRLADVTIIDRETGAVLPTHYHRGEYWVAGAPGARYSIAIRNRQGGRVLAVTAVDGVNVISGDTASWAQTGYVFESRQHYEITGWRKSNAEVAAFNFTAAPASYAARSGRPANIGVIGVALFRERVVHYPQTAIPYDTPEPLADVTRERASAAPAAPAPAAGANSTTGSRLEAADRMFARDHSFQRLGTGHGQREYSRVQHTDFERLQEAPNEVIRIRYDSRQNLMAMGIIPRPRPAHPRPDPFPESPLAGYVPDPPAWH